jgi:hypothetical protein
MNHHNFVLQPFAQVIPMASFSITGTISRGRTLLTITYILAGPLPELIIAPPAATPARQWDLWETTCFEFFLAIRDAIGYWEFNLSPAGHWNVFRLAGYRQGLAEEPAIRSLPFTSHQQTEKLTLSLDVDLSDIIPGDRPLKAAISTVLHHQGGRLSYWALTHPGPEPDFHSPQGFVLKL